MNYSSFFNKKFVYSKNNNHIVVLGDSIEIMKNMNKSTVDLIFADEPYNIGKDFGNNKDTWKSTKEYIEWNKTWIKEAMRILKDNGTMYLMTSTQYMPYIDIFIQENYHIVSRIIWNYDSSGVQSKIVVLY